MAGVTEAVRETAEAAHEWLETSAAAAGVAGIALVFGVMTPLGPPLVVFGGIAGAMSLVARKFSKDPPRDDYAASTYLPASPIQFELLPSDPVAAEIRDCVQELSRVDGLLVAGLVAFEREQGAALAGDEVSRDARYEERRRYVGESVEALVNLNRPLNEFADALEAKLADQGEALSLEGARTTYDEQELPDSLLVMLYRVGMPIASTRRMLRLMSTRSGSVAVDVKWTDVFRVLGETLSRFGVALYEWQENEGSAPASLEPGEISRGPGGQALAFEDGPYEPV